MKKTLKKIIICLLVGFLCNSSAKAQLTGGISIEGPRNGAMATGIGKKAGIGKLKEVYRQIQEKVTKIMGELGKLLGEQETYLAKTPGTKKIKDGGSVDLHDKEAIAEVFYELFLQYPSTDNAVNYAYEKQGVHLYYDTMVEVQSAADALLERLNDQRDRIEALQAEGFDGGEQSSGGADQGASDEYKKKIYHNAYKMQFELNRLLRITEEVVALRNQYEAVRLLRQPRAFPAAPAKESGSSEVKKSSFLSGHTQVAFAQMLSENVRGNLQSSAAANVQKISVGVESSAKSSAVSSDSTVLRSSIKFSVPNTTAQEAPFDGNEDDLAAIARITEVKKVIDDAMYVHNVIQKMPEYKDSYMQYKLLLELHEKAVDSIKTADQCVIKYLGRRYDEPNSVWFGQATPPADTCDYDSRKGLSGWAITAFEVANASSGNGLDIDAFSEQEMDSSLSASDEVKDTSAEEHEEGERMFANALSSPEKEQEFSNMVRDLSLLNWQIGRKAALLLTEDQYSKNPKFGKAARPFPLWNDQRSYYNQYLSGKYGNMKAYINGLDVSEAALDLFKLINNSQKDEDDRLNGNYASSISNYLSEHTPSAVTSKLLSSKTAALAAINRKQDNELAVFETSLRAYQEQLASVSAAINEMTDKINRLDAEMRENEAKAENAKKEIEMMDKRNKTVYSSSYVMAKQTFNEAGEAHAKNIVQQGKLKAENKKLKNKRDTLYAKIDTINNKISAIQDKYNEEIVAVEMDYDERISALQNQSQTAVTLTDVATKLKFKKSRLYSLLNIVDNLVSEARSCAVQAIDAHYQSLTEMAKNDQLYMNSNNPKVVDMHVALINKLKNLPKECFIVQAKSVASDLTIGYSTIVSRLTEIFKAPINSKICAENDCTSPDSQYFVGLPAKARDFTAPHTPLTAHYPPVRDMVHFDTTDYRNIKIGSGGKIARNAFLNYGAKQPYIWELLLSDKAFVERGVNLAAVLHKGGEAKAFMRGQMLPCRYGRLIVDIDKKAKYQITDIDRHDSKENIARWKDLGPCRDLRISAGIFGLLSVYNVYDVEVDDTVRAGSEEEIVDPYSSELGMFLRYNGGNVKINERPYEGFSTIIKKEEKAKKKGKLDFDATDNAYERAMFNKNQIGDFLYFVDKERTIKKNVDMLEISMEEFKETIKEIFAAMNFELKEDLDLSKSEDYDYVLKKLQTRKNTFVGQISSELETIKHNNPVVKERFDVVNNYYNALVQDAQSLVVLGPNTESGSPLEASIKTAKANQKVLEKTRKEGYSALKREINNYEQPVCMPY